jgi:hypothetical protein
MNGPLARDLSTEITEFLLVQQPRAQLAHPTPAVPVVVKRQPKLMERR